MADSLDKFVLQYTVDMKDAIARLEKLNQKVEGVNKEAGKAKGGFKEFASGATDELSKVVPGIDKVSAAVKMMGAEFAAASVAVGVLAVGIKAVMDAREQFGVQRKVGMESGVSGVRLEEYQRKFVKNSSGNVSRDAALDGTKFFSDLISKAYADPTRLGTENRQLKLLGVDPGARGQGVTPLNTAMVDLARNFQKMTPAQVQGIAKTIGMSQDWALTLQKIGPSIGKITEQSTEEIKLRDQTAKKFADYNDSVQKMNEQFVEMENVIAEHLLDPLTKFVGLLKEMAGVVPKGVENLSKNGTGKVTKRDEKEQDAVKDTSKGVIGWLRRTLGIADPVKAEAKRVEDEKKAADGTSDSSTSQTPDAKQVARQSKETADKLADDLDAQNRKGLETANDMSLAVNMFAGAVASFSNAVDERQAWAAWAGEIGKASGLGKSDEGAGTPDIKAGAGPVGPTKFDDFFKKASSKFGIDINLLKNVARVESHMDPSLTSPQGAQGIMQVMPSNFKSLGVKNGYDPEQSIMAGAKLLAEYIKAAGGDIRKALMMYHAGYDQSGWGPLTRAYPGKVLGDGQPDGLRILPQSQYKGESRDKMNLRAVQANIAARLGAPLEQIQQGGVNRGDVAFARSQLEGGYQNNIFDLKKQLQTVGLPNTVRAKLLRELRDQQTGLGMMQKFGDQVVGKSRDGERSITIGERAVVINVMGSGNPEEVAHAVQKRFDDHLGELVNGNTDGLKY